LSLLQLQVYHLGYMPFFVSFAYLLLIKD